MGGLSLRMCVLPASLLFFCKKERKKKTKLNTKECVKSSNANRSGAFGRPLRRQRSKCVQLNCLHSSADKTAQASSTWDSGRASDWMLLSPKEAIITHIPARAHSWMGRMAKNCLLRPNQTLAMGQARPQASTGSETGKAPHHAYGRSSSKIHKSGIRSGFTLKLSIRGYHGYQEAGFG